MGHDDEPLADCSINKSEQIAVTLGVNQTGGCDDSNGDGIVTQLEPPRQHYKRES